MTFDRGEAGYQGWRRLLAPLWIMLRRTELAPASLLAHAAILDNILLAGTDNELIGQRFPGEVAAAVAAMLIHQAKRQPLVLVIDDAHRGGASSDRLLLDVTRLANAHGVGLVAALRPEELEEDSALNDYCDQAAGRAAADIVTTIRVPPLDLETTADLLRGRTGVQPPPQIVELVLRQTGGCPQLINSTQLQVPPKGDENAAWVSASLMLRACACSSPPFRLVRKQRARCCRRPRCAPWTLISSRTSSRLSRTWMRTSFERVLDGERRHGSVLTPQIPGYRFQHDNWIDALINTCPPARRRTLHARRLELLLADPASDPRQLARHAIGAGAALVGATGTGDTGQASS